VVDMTAVRVDVAVAVLLSVGSPGYPTNDFSLIGAHETQKRRQRRRSSAAPGEERFTAAAAAARARQNVTGGARRSRLGSWYLIQFFED